MNYVLGMWMVEKENGGNYFIVGLYWFLKWIFWLIFLIYWN